MPCPGQKMADELGLKLSWPRDNDTRRSIIGEAPTQAPTTTPSPAQEPRMVQVTDRDLAMHYDFSGATKNGTNITFHPRGDHPACCNGTDCWYYLVSAQKALDPQIMIHPTKLNAEEHDLFEYCKSMIVGPVRTFDLTQTSQSSASLPDRSPHSAATRTSLARSSSASP